MRENVRQMTSYPRNAMNVAHLNNTKSGGVHIEEHNTEFLGNQYEANTNLSLATPDTPYYPFFTVLEHLRVCPSTHNKKIVIFKLLMLEFWVFNNSAMKIFVLHKIHTTMNFKTHHLMLGE
ncbi:hypothetical protein H5410_052631 [Solanum commersonii]|uniref:Uncharacterized protein n=1 Tax=Solanum commersonii TaxID=4109 RepID=A0A9J5X3Y1_SOLCO|nr:hypothetical protein H5410_052631 [Solanum commersonii]